MEKWQVTYQLTSRFASDVVKEEVKEYAYDPRDEIYNTLIDERELFPMPDWAVWEKEEVGPIAGEDEDIDLSKFNEQYIYWFDSDEWWTARKYKS